MADDQELSIRDLLDFVPTFGEIGEIRRMTFREIARVGDTEQELECDIEYGPSPGIMPPITARQELADTHTVVVTTKGGPDGDQANADQDQIKPAADQ